jgi:O-methyltransferase involved in polyketide biosynthesis
MADFTQDNWQDSLLSCIAFDKSKLSFCSLIGICYYLSKQDFRRLVHIISQLIPEGSSIVFDYPDQDTHTEKAGERAKKQTMMAGCAGEKMLAAYSYN